MPSPYYRDTDSLWDHYFKKELDSAADKESWELLMDLGRRYGIEWVWEHRRRLVELMRFFVIETNPIAVNEV